MLVFSHQIYVIAPGYWIRKEIRVRNVEIVYSKHVGSFSFYRNVPEISNKIHGDNDY